MTARWWVLGALLAALVAVASAVQPTLAMGRDIRWEAERSIVLFGHTLLGDPGPAIAAAARLARDPGAPLYAADLAHGSSFIYPPLAALLYRPLAFLPEDDARDWLAVVSHTLALAIVAMMVQLACARRRVTAGVVGACVAAAVAFYPLVHALQLNQATLFVTAFLGASWIALDEGNEAAAGVLFALTLAIKPQLVLALPALAWGARRMVGWAAATAAALLVASLLYAGLAAHVDYATRVLPSLSGGYAYYANQGVNGLLQRLRPGVDIAVFEQPSAAPWITAVTGVVSVGALAGSLVVGRLWHAWRVPPVWTFALSWLTATASSPVAWQHHYAPALFVFALLARALADDPTLRRRALGALAFGSFALMAAYFEVRHAQGVLTRLGASTVLYGAVTLGAAVVAVAEAESRRAKTRNRPSEGAGT